MKTLRPFIVGIDPGQQTGVAILQRATATTKERVLNWTTRDFHTVQEFLINTFPNKNDVKVFVEVPNTMLYDRNVSQIRKEELTVMYHAGGTRREAQLLASSLRRLGFDVDEVQPVREHKWDTKRMELFTKSKKRSNQHERDAVRLAVFNANKR